MNTPTRFGRLAATVSALACVVATASCADDSFVAFQRDFANFRTWERVELPPEGACLNAPPGSPPAPRAVYINRRPPPGATEFPIGTIIVKTTECGDPQTWTIHAMVKRGGGYNAAGALGWEYFELGIARPDSTTPNVPLVNWRGTVPNDGHGYTDDQGVVQDSCNSCHATPAARRNDSVLSPSLSLGAR
jgi:hypothetical protein